MKKHREAKICHICEEGEFENNPARRKVFDHNHLTGKELNFFFFIFNFLIFYLFIIIYI